MIQFKNPNDPSGNSDILVAVPCIAIVAGFSCFEFSKAETYEAERLEDGKLVPFTIMGKDLLSYEYDTALITCREIKNEAMHKMFQKIGKFYMKQCKPGDRLISKNGLVFVYVGKTTHPGSDEAFPHLVRWPGGMLGTRRNNGMAFLEPNELDIVGFAVQSD